jgi:hypothetical protein
MEQDQSALVSSNYSNLPREAKKTADSTFDRIYKYYHSNKTRIELTDEEIRIRERWEKAWLLLCRNRTQKQVVELIEKLFNVKKSVAYDDVRNAMMLFSNPQNDLKDAKRAIAETMALHGANTCMKKGDMDGYYKFLKAYQEINRLDAKEDDIVPDMMKKLKPAAIIIVSSPAELEAQANAMQQDLIEDIEHTEE